MMEAHGLNANNMNTARGVPMEVGTQTAALGLEVK